MFNKLTWPSIKECIEFKLKFNPGHPKVERKLPSSNENVAATLTTYNGLVFGFFDQAS